MGNLDMKFYWAVFLRRLPYFLVIAALLTALATTIAFVLPPIYRSQASMLVEPQQIPGELAESTVPINPFEQIQIIEQRLMTRANLLDLAKRIGLFADQPEMTAGQIVSGIRQNIEFIGFEPDVTKLRGVPGATIIGVAFEAPTAALAHQGANELVNLVLQENVRLRTGRAGDTLDFFQAESDRLEEQMQRQSQEIADFKTANVSALPDSLTIRRAQQEREQQRLIDLEREEAGLRNQRATAVWVFERTGRSGTTPVSPEEEELQKLRSALIQQQAVYRANSPTIRVLQTRIAALEALVEEQRAARALPGADGEAAQPLTDLEVELAPIDERLKFIADEKATIEASIAELEASIQATPANEMTIAGLERGLAALQAQYDAAVRNRSQAQVGERIEVLSKGERFSLIEQPTLPGAPAKPKRLLISAAGMVGGIGAGIGFIVLMEMLNRSIRRPVDISAKLGIQPFATVPYIRTRGEARWKGWTMIAVLLLVLVGIPLGLLALHTYYMPLDLLLAPLLEPAVPPVPAS